MKCVQFVATCGFIFTVVDFVSAPFASRPKVEELPSSAAAAPAKAPTPTPEERSPSMYWITVNYNEIARKKARCKSFLKNGLCKSPHTKITLVSVPIPKVLGRLRVKTCKLRVTCKTRNPHRKMYGITRNNAQGIREHVYGFLPQFVRQIYTT